MVRGPEAGAESNEVAMKTVLIRSALAGVLALAALMPAAAHHSFAAAYDADKPITVKGVMTELRLENPHSWIFLNGSIDGKGKAEKWSFEASTPTSLIRGGLKPDFVKPGEEVTVKGWHARDAAQNVGAARELVLADGRAFAVGNGVGSAPR